MENFENEHRCGKKDTFKKCLLTFLATLLGAFLAFYFVVDMTLKTLLSPEYQMHRAHKMMEKMDRQMARDMHKNAMKTPVLIKENDNEYKVFVDLKPFGNKSDNVSVTVEDGNVLKIVGSNDDKKGDREKSMNVVQMYSLDKKVDVNKITRSEKHGRYEVTIPFAEN